MVPTLALVGLLSVCVAQSGAIGDEEEACVEASNTNMLQLGQARVDSQAKCGHLVVEGCSPEANFPCSNNCPSHTHGADCYRPIPDVMAEHPGEDGYCYFNATAFWVIYQGPVPHFEEEAVQGILGLRGSMYAGHNKGPLITYTFEDAKNLTTNVDSPHYSYDDLYAYSLGFLQGQGLDPTWMRNSSLWISLSQQKCEEIQEKYNFSKEELVLADWLDRNAVLSTMTLCSTHTSMPGSLNPQVLKEAGWHGPKNCQPITDREYAKHHCVKCLLGYRNSAADMAYLNARACLLPGNHIGHFSDCPYVPDVDF